MSGEKTSIVTTEPSSGGIADSPPAYYVTGTNSENQTHNVSGPMPTDPSLNTVYLAIITMIFCCWPCGLIGLIYGIQAMQQYYRGEYPQSQATEKTAKRWAICSVISGVIFIVGIILFSILIQVITFALTSTK